MAVDDITLSRKARLRARRDGDTEWVDVSASLRGLTGLSYSHVEGLRQIPGGKGFAASQRTGYRAGSTAHTVDDNQYTHGLYLWGTGVDFDYELSPKGTDSGDPVLTYDVVVTVTHNVVARGARTFTVTATHDGPINEGTH